MLLIFRKIDCMNRRLSQFFDFILKLDNFSFKFQIFVLRLQNIILKFENFRLKSINFFLQLFYNIRFSFRRWYYFFIYGLYLDD